MTGGGAAGRGAQGCRCRRGVQGCRCRRAAPASRVGSRCGAPRTGGRLSSCACSTLAAAGEEEEEEEGEDDGGAAAGGGGGGGGAAGGGQQQMLFIPGLGYFPLSQLGNIPGLGGLRAQQAAPQPEGEKDWATFDGFPVSKGPAAGPASRL